MDATIRKNVEEVEDVYSDTTKLQLLTELSNYQNNEHCKNPMWTLGVSRNGRKIIKMLLAACIYKFIQSIRYRGERIGMYIRLIRLIRTDGSPLRMV